MSHGPDRITTRVNVAIRDEIMREIVDPDVSGAGAPGSGEAGPILHGDLALYARIIRRARGQWSAPHHRHNR